MWCIEYIAYISKINYTIIVLAACAILTSNHANKDVNTVPDVNVTVFMRYCFVKSSKQFTLFTFF